MKINIIVILSMLIAVGCSESGSRNDQQAIDLNELTWKIFEKGSDHCDLDFYAGTLMLHGMSEYALLNGNGNRLDTIVSLFEQFNNGAIKAKGNFISYEPGGSGVAYLSWKGAADKLDQQVAAAADKMMTTQKRTHDNLMTAPNLTHEMFIDVVFAVSPYLLYAGLRFDKPEYIDYAVFQTLESFKILNDDKTGLVHQGRGFQGEGVMSDDCWSRGNGWGAFALAILARDLPDSHPQRKEVEELAVQFFTAVIEHQNEQGLWHQEMTAPESYVETSGSGLLLYGLGIVLEKGLLDKKYLKNFEIGISNYLSYVGSDGSVSHCAFSCRCPGDGSKEVYIHHPWVYNDRHAFGPAVLAFTQAVKMGYSKIVPATRLGEYAIVDTPEAPRTYAAIYKGRAMNWENDRIAFRAYGPEVRGQVGSGIDVWAKKVDYSIIDKWYSLNEQGQNYHDDRGEGCDFYNVGRRSGCGGLAIWKDGRPHPAETYDRYHIIKNQDDKIEVDLHYHHWQVDGDKYGERRKIEMQKGTNLFKVTSTIRSPKDTSITVAIGLSTFGKAEVSHIKETGMMTVWETFGPDHGLLGTAVLADPERVVSFESWEGDQFVLLQVRTNTPFSYYAGAGWSKNGRFETKENWIKYVAGQAKQLN